MDHGSDDNDHLYRVDVTETQRHGGLVEQAQNWVIVRFEVHAWASSLDLKYVRETAPQIPQWNPRRHNDHE
jgi:hypothetical protein